MSNNTVFKHILGNTLFATLVNSLVWFSLTYWVFVETRSILATSLIAGIFAVTNAVSAIFFGAIVDHNKKKRVMLVSSAVSFVFYSIGAFMYVFAPEGALAMTSGAYLWVFIVVLLFGSVVGNMRMIALTTIVTLLFDTEERGRKNGLVGIVNGASFAVTSVLSGLVIGFASMGTAIGIALVVTFFVILHILTVQLPESEVVDTGLSTREKIDFSGTLRMIREMPGLFALILFTTFNNFLGGAFMALMDSYGLSLVTVQTWGILWGFLSFAFIAGGMLTAKFGVGKNPLMRLFLLNSITWTSCIFFTIQPSIVLLALGAIVWMSCFPMIEASEQTIIQKIIPFERQGRVIGFAQTIEQAATPVTAFMIGPITHFFVVPFMTDGYGAQAIGSWFGTGPDRAIALVFTAFGIIGLIVTQIARRSRATKKLGAYYMESTEVAQ